MKTVPGPNHPFRLLLTLEWILLGIAVLAIFSPLRFPAPHRGAPPEGMLVLRGIAFVLLVTLGLLGLRLPPPARLLQVGYIALGFALCWLIALLGGRGMSAFPALLLIVVMRGCLLFPWGGRVLVAAFAYGSFLLLQVMMLLELRPLGVPLGRSLPRLAQRLPPDLLRSVVVGVTVNGALLFGMVLVFVLLLVSTVVAEYRNRQELAIANQRLRDYALVVENQATLHERNRIAREIHDSVGHALAAQSIQLENVAVTLENQQMEVAAQHLKKARQLGRDALQSVRQSVAALRTDPLKHQPLPRAIATLIHEFKRNHTIPITAHLPDTLTLPDEQKTALYRITQEALTNIAKHSHAHQIQVHLAQHATQTSLSIQDDGQGFDPAANTTGFGLQSMRERTAALGGSFNLTSQPGQGCHIRVTIPTSSPSLPHLP